MKKKLPSVKNILFASVLILLFLSSCTTNDWPQFRGNNQNIVESANDLPVEWNDSLNMRWKNPVEGESWSSPIIAGDKLFYTSVLLVKKAPPKEENPDNVVSSQGNGNNSPRSSRQEDETYKKDVYRWQITCLDLNSGEELWKVISFEGNPRIKKHSRNNYACETPVTDGKRVYAYFGMLGLYCYDINGNPIWEKDLGAYKTLNGWGTGSSPVLNNDKIFIQLDNEENSFIVALEALTGDEIWRKDRDEKTTYSTPVIWKNNLRTELFTLGNTARSYNPENGELLWEMKIGKGRSIPSPVFDNEHIYFGNAGGRGEICGLFAIKAGSSGNITPLEGETKSMDIVWSDTLANTGNPSPVLYNGLIYLLPSRGGELSCFDALNGELIYTKKVENVGACWASPWIYNDRLYFYDEKGTTHIVKTGPEFEVLGSNSINDKFWASVAAGKDSYIFKGLENIYCVGK